MGNYSVIGTCTASGCDFSRVVIADGLVFWLFLSPTDCCLSTCYWHTILCVALGASFAVPWNYACVHACMNACGMRFVLSLHSYITYLPEDPKEPLGIISAF